MGRNWVEWGRAVPAARVQPGQARENTPTRLAGASWRRATPHIQRSVSLNGRINLNNKEHGRLAGPAPRPGFQVLPQHLAGDGRRVTNANGAAGAPDATHRLPTHETRCSTPLRRGKARRRDPEQEVPRHRRAVQVPRTGSFSPPRGSGPPQLATQGPPTWNTPAALVPCRSPKLTVERRHSAFTLQARPICGALGRWGAQRRRSEVHYMQHGVLADRLQPSARKGLHRWQKMW